MHTAQFNSRPLRIALGLPATHGQAVVFEPAAMISRRLGGQRPARRAPSSEPDRIAGSHPPGIIRTSGVASLPSIAVRRKPHFARRRRGLARPIPFQSTPSPGWRENGTGQRTGRRPPIHVALGAAARSARPRDATSSFASRAPKDEQRLADWLAEELPRRAWGVARAATRARRPAAARRATPATTRSASTRRGSARGRRRSRSRDARSSSSP